MSEGCWSNVRRAGWEHDRTVESVPELQILPHWIALSR